MSTITLKKPRNERLSLPPRAITRVAIIESAKALREMQQPKTHTPAVVVVKDTTESDALSMRVAELEAQQRAQASAAWLEAEAAATKARQARSHALQTHREQARVCDNTRPDLTPAVVITTDAVRLKLPLNPRTAVPMRLPLISALKRWVMRKP